MHFTPGDNVTLTAHMSVEWHSLPCKVTILLSRWKVWIRDVHLCNFFHILTAKSKKYGSLEMYFGKGEHVWFFSLHSILRGNIVTLAVYTNDCDAVFIELIITVLHAIIWDFINTFSEKRKGRWRGESIRVQKIKRWICEWKNLAYSVF